MVYVLMRLLSTLQYPGYIVIKEIKSEILSLTFFLPLTYLNYCFAYERLTTSYESLTSILRLLTSA